MDHIKHGDFLSMAKSWINYEDRLNRVVAHIHDNLDENLDFQTLANVAALSPWHWHRIYHAIRGETAIATAKRLRLQRAGVDLAQTVRPLDEIAARAGYGSVQAFTRAFAQAFGLPPAKFRESGSHADFKAGQLSPPNAGWTIEIRNQEALPTLGVQHNGPYMAIERAFETLFAQANIQKLLPPDIRLIGVFHDDPTLVPEASLRSHAAIALSCAIAPLAPLERLDIIGGEYAVLRHKGPYSAMRAAYAWLFGTWLPQSGREAADAPVIEEYLNVPTITPPSDLLTDMWLPLRPCQEKYHGEKHLE